MSGLIGSLKEKKVGYVELIYDLIFVYVIGRNNALLHNFESGFVEPGSFAAYIMTTLAVIRIRICSACSSAMACSMITSLTAKKKYQQARVYVPAHPYHFRHEQYHQRAGIHAGRRDQPGVEGNFPDRFFSSVLWFPVFAGIQVREGEGYRRYSELCLRAAGIGIVFIALMFLLKSNMALNIAVSVAFAFSMFLLIYCYGKRIKVSERRDEK